MLRIMFGLMEILLLSQNLIALSHALSM